jgi:hypothetical protein
MNQRSDNHVPEELRQKVRERIKSVLQSMREVPFEAVNVEEDILSYFAPYYLSREKTEPRLPRLRELTPEEAAAAEKAARKLWPEMFEMDYDPAKTKPYQYNISIEEMPASATKEDIDALKTAIRELEKRLPTEEEDIERSAKGVRIVKAETQDESKAKSAKALFTKEGILEEVRKKLRRSPQLIADTLYACNMWLDFAPWPYDQWTEEGFRDFEDFLASPDRNKGKGYTKETQVKMLHKTKYCFDICKVDWPKITTRAEESDVESLPFETREIKMMVDAAKADKLLPAQAAYLAISTVFGLRCEELTKICHPGPEGGRKDPNDIDYDGKRIFIRTVKGGDKRWQALPDEIVPYLKQYDFKRAYSPDRFAEMCGLIETKAGVIHISRRAWHGIRRSVDTALMVSLKENNIENASDDVRMFMRWKLSADMEKRYDKEDKLKNDRLVFKYHPLLAMWRD